MTLLSLHSANPPQLLLGQNSQMGVVKRREKGGTGRQTRAAVVQAGTLSTDTRQRQTAALPGRLPHAAIGEGWPLLEL